MSRNDHAWEKILEDVSRELKRGLARDGFFDLDSGQIKRYREPRLACKIDFREQIPKPLKDQGLSVLAIENGKYRLARTDPFLGICIPPENLSPNESFPIPRHIEALSSDRISSESKALDAALASGMLRRVFGEDVDLVLRGREYCKPIEFGLQDTKKDRTIRYQADKVQVEVDGGYEGERQVHLVEAKMGTASNMNLRQLLYPQLHYQNLFGKKVRTYVLLYELGLRKFHFYRFDLAEDYRLNYRQCALIGQLLEQPRTWEDICAVPVNPDLTNPDAPFPQADDFDKVVLAFWKLASLGAGSISKEDMFSNHDITPRQFSYYASVLVWMRLVEKVSGSGQPVRYCLSETGKRLSDESERGLLFSMAQIVFSNEVCHLFLTQDAPPVSREIRKRHRLEGESTFMRRMRTVKSWRQYFQRIFPPRDSG